MAYTNNNKRIHDTPIWLPTAQFRTATANTGSMTTAKDTNNRYVYYLSGALFYKYDTYKDVHIKLASPNTSGTTPTSIKYSGDEGYRCNCLSGASASIIIPGLYSDLFVGKSIKITTGLGFGQERIISDVGDPIVSESGVVTAATSASITDTTKRWEINQYIGYLVRLTFGTGTSQVRKILYNDANTLYFYDINYQQLEAWNNTAFSSVAPYAIPSSTAGVQSNYFIQSIEVTVSVPWTTIPDTTSSMLIKGGGVFMLSTAAGAPWSTFQFYDVLSDVWSYKTALGGNLLAALGTDISIEMITEETPFVTGTASSGTARTLVDTTQSMIVDRYCNFSIKVTSGPGSGEENRIVANGTDYFEIDRPWQTQPTSSTTYQIHGEINRIYLVGNGASSMYQYSIEHDSWFTGQSIDYGQTRNAGVRFAGQEDYGITTAVRNTGGITVLNSTPTVKGLNYAVGDLFNITTGGTIGKGRVETISAGGVVESVSLYSTGLNYTTGPGKATTIISGSGNNALTVNITTVGTVGRITLASNTNLAQGDTIVITGANDTAWNGTSSVLAIDSLTTFDVVTTATLTLVPSFVNSTVLVVDSSKSWVVDEHIGKLVKIDTAGPSPTTQLRRIVSNTATTLTVQTIVAGANGTSRFTIINPEAFGRDRQYNYSAESGEGRASSGTSTTLVDSTKTWLINQWLGYRIRILAGTGVGKEVIIVGNDATTLTLYLAGFTPDITTKYQIMATFGQVNGAGGISTLALTPTAAGTGYNVGDLLAITGGTAMARVVSVNGGLVTGVILAFGGISGYTAITGVATTNIIGTGSGCTVNVTAITVVGSTTSLQDNTKNWPVNKWAGKRVVITSGTGQRNEYTIASNTVNTLTWGAATAPDSTSTYTILSIAPRSTGTGLRWIYGNTEVDKRGIYLICPRGGATNTIDRYNITTDDWDYSVLYTPQSETLTTGSSYCYDGVDNFYFTIGVASDFIYVFSLNIYTLSIDGAFQTTVLQGATHIGSLMEIVSSPDGGKFLFLGICSSRLMYKTLIY